MTHAVNSKIQIFIDNIPIGPGCPPYIVAEVGINHNGEIERALEMVHVAKNAGCNAVKFQTFKASQLVSSPEQMFTYYSMGKSITESMLSMFTRFELPDTAWSVIKSECQNIGITFLSTPQNPSDLKLLLGLGLPAIKVGSDDFNNLPLLTSYSKTGLPLILSTGMSDLADTYYALETVGGLDNYPVIVLVCTSQYPTPLDDAHLARITSLRSAFPNVPIGFSDHTQGVLASSLAVALGAVFLEKHFTLSHDLPGPDHWFSEDPNGLTAWVDHIRKSYRMMGDSVVRPTVTELTNKKDWQRRLVAARDIRYQELITEESITTRRVAGGLGLPPSMTNYIVGKKSPKEFKLGDPIELC